MERAYSRHLSISTRVVGIQTAARVFTIAATVFRASRCPQSRSVCEGPV